MEHLSPEITAQRAAETRIDRNARIADAVAMFLIGKPLDQQTWDGALRMAFDRFSGEYEKHRISAVVIHQLENEGKRRAIIARLPPPQRKDRFGRPIKEKAA